MSHGTHSRPWDAPTLTACCAWHATLQPLDLGELQLQPFTVPHDAREPLQLTCSDGASTLGILTDLGHATAHVLERLAGCHCADAGVQPRPGPAGGQSSYPPFPEAARRWATWGHLSNADAAAMWLRSGGSTNGSAAPWWPPT
jgi:hypothetical protein